MPDSPALSSDLVTALRCPETHQPLALADPDQLDRIRAAVPTGDNATDAPAIEGALLTEDGRIAYPIQDGFPILLLAEAIRLPETGNPADS